MRDIEKVAERVLTSAGMRRIAMASASRSRVKKDLRANATTIENENGSEDDSDDEQRVIVSEEDVGATLRTIFQEEQESEEDRRRRHASSLVFHSSMYS